MRKYINKKDDGSWTLPAGLAKLMYRAERAVKQGSGPFKLFQDDEQVGVEMTRPIVLDRFKAVISKREIGSTFRIRKKGGDVVFTARAVKVLSDVDSTSGNTKSDIYWNAVKATWAMFSPRYAGSYVCKEISPGVKSQHSYGNAVDVFFDTLYQQEKVANWVAANAATLNPYHIIDLNRTWTKGVGWHATPGNNHYHLHVDFDPQCSGACGVKNCG